MIEGIEPLYQRIAGSMTAAISEVWATAEFYAIFYPSGSIYEAEYVGLDGVAHNFQPAADGSRAIRELRQAFKQANHAIWGRIWFVLRADGSFDARWGYEDCDANGDALFDEAAELHRHEERRLRLIVGQPRSG